MVATIALFAALGGGSFAVAAALKKNSVGAKQIQKNAVDTAEIAKKAVTGKKLDSQAVTSNKIAGSAVTNGALATDSVTGDKVNESTLGAVPQATKALNVLSAVVRPDGSLEQSTQSNTTSARESTGIYVVDFNRNVTSCTAVASIGNANPPVAPTIPPTPAVPFPNAPEAALIGTSRALGNDEAIRVLTRSPSSPFGPEDHGFQLNVVC